MDKESYIDNIDTINLYGRPNRSAVYFLYESGEIVYIGKSKRILTRLAEHEIYYDEVKILHVNENILDRLEIILIKHHLPIQNTILYPRTDVFFLPNEYAYLRLIGITFGEFIEYDNPERYKFLGDI